MASNTNEYLIKLTDLLELEQKEDLRQYQLKFQGASLKERKANGVLLYPLKHLDFRYQSGEQLIADLQLHPNDINNRHGFSNGKMVQVFAINDESLNVNGVVNRIKNDKVTITINGHEFPNWMTHNGIAVQLLFDDRTYREMFYTLSKLINNESDRIGYLKKVLIGGELPFFKDSTPVLPNHLNKSQNEAVYKVALANDFAVIHGPPGTGKTTTLVECIKTELTQVPQVLVCAPSNAAIDVLSERLAANGIKVVRIGHPARVTDEMLNQTLEAQTAQHNNYKLYKDLKKRSEEYFKMAGKWKRTFGKTEREQKKIMFNEAKALKQDAERTYRDIIEDVLFSTRVIACTLVGANHPKLKGMQFDTVFIDEAGQALEPACWIPILKAKKVVFAGDHLQLPPTVKSIEAKKGGLDQTLFERAIQEKSATSLLKEQYRMNDVIMRFSSGYFYDNELLSNVQNRDWRIFADDAPMEFIDTAGTGYFEEQHPDTRSSFNSGEVEVIIKHLNQYLEQIQVSGYDSPESIGIVSPYKAQVELFRATIESAGLPDELRKKIVVNTIDGFQGQERDLIYVSLVRSNEEGEIGFLSDERRMNVGLTRAKRKLVVVGDSATIGAKSKFYNKFLDYVQSEAKYLSAFELMYD